MRRMIRARWITLGMIGGSLVVNAARLAAGTPPSELGTSLGFLIGLVVGQGLFELFERMRIRRGPEAEA
jgi:hypothetical protein